MELSMDFNPGIDIKPITNTLDFEYGKDVFGPPVEKRYLKDIRQSLKDPAVDGPEIVYAIAMDVGEKIHRSILHEKMLLFGVVTYARGQLGEEPVRSQGHIHRISEHSGWSPPEVYEIWTGKAIIYMQEFVKDNPGKCFAVYAETGDVVIVPPGWAHATISADINQPLTFGAWCDREYGFEYEKIRAYSGLAWYPLLDEVGIIIWQQNNRYHKCELQTKKPSDYSYLGISKHLSIYSQFERDPDLFQFVSKPFLKEKEWQNFIP